MLGAIFKYGITGLFLLIDGIVYFLVAQLFDLYEILAKSQILSNDFISDVADRMYVVIGIFMLFVVTYSLLKALVNPDNIKDTGKIATNIVVSIVLLSVVPTIFFYARELQSIIVRDNIIGRLVLEDKEVDFASEGSNIALTMLEAFLEIPDDATGEEDGKIWLNPVKIAWVGARFLISGEESGIPTWGDFKDSINEGNYATFLTLGLFADVASGEDATYIPIVSTICGGFMIYCLISFCLDLGVRVIKLGFYQIIAPVPIMMRLIPNKKNVFDNWVKATLATYMEVFIRIFVMVLVVFLASSIFNLENLALSGDVGVFGLIIIVLGLFAFAKQAPKLISNVIGIDSGNLKLGIGGKLDASGPLGKGINYVGKGTFGALTGGLGGAYGAAINGAGGAAGFLFGAINGWKGKKGQFNKQRTGIYSNVLDQKGTAGWFGGRGFIDTQKDRYKDRIKDAYLKSEETKVQKVEESAEFKQRQNEIRAKTISENSQKYNTLSQQLVEKLREFENEKTSKIKELMNQMQQESQAFEKEKSKKMHDLQLELDEARDKKDTARQSQIFKQMAEIGNSSYSNKNLSNAIANERSRTSTTEIDNLRKEIDKVSSINEDSIFKATQNEFMSANAGYKASSKYVAQKAAEKAAKKWREEHADEAAIQETIYENAFKNASKGGSPAGFGGKTGGPSPSSGGGSDSGSKGK